MFDEEDDDGNRRRKASSGSGGSSGGEGSGASAGDGNRCGSDKRAADASPKKFEACFDAFVHANSSRLICKHFDEMCESLQIPSRRVLTSRDSTKQANSSTSAQQASATNVHSQNTASGRNNRSFSSIGSSAAKRLATSVSGDGDGDEMPPHRITYQLIKARTNYWKANELWKKYDKRVNSKMYQPRPARDLNVLIIGAGPVGLRLSKRTFLLLLLV